MAPPHEHPQIAARVMGDALAKTVEEESPHAVFGYTLGRSHQTDTDDLALGSGLLGACEDDDL